MKRIGGRIDREIPENAVSAFKRQRVELPDGTCGYRVVRPEWEKILTALRRGECNALMVPDIDRAMRDPRTLEDLIDVARMEATEAGLKRERRRYEGRVQARRHAVAKFGRGVG